MFRYLSRKSVWFVLFALGGTIFQASCATIAAETVGRLGRSITNEYIRSYISDWLGISTGFPF